MDPDVCDCVFMTLLLATINHEHLDCMVLSSVSHPPCCRLAAMAMAITTFDFQVPGPVTWIQIPPMTSICIFLITLDQHLGYDNWEVYSGSVVFVTRQKKFRPIVSL